MFARYAAVVKNLRGVVVFNLDEEGVWDSIAWLVQRFKYRNLGIPPKIVNQYYGILKSYLNGNPFIGLVYPVKELENLTRIFIKLYHIPDKLAEGLVLASVYISPLLLVGDTYRAGVEDNAIEVVRICKDKKMDVKQWKLHLRIADYTILDFYNKSVEESMKILEYVAKSNIDSKEVKDILDKRLDRVKKDTKRYWRIKCSEGKPFLYYIDPLKSIVEGIINGTIKPNELSLDYAAGLAIIPVVYIPPKQQV